MNLQYVCASSEDIPVIFSLAKELIDTYEDVTAIDYEKVLRWVKRKIETEISGYSCVLIDGSKCAYFRLCGDGELDDLYVFPEFRGRGIGSRILAKCIEESRSKLYLYVFSRNIRAISFYEKYGFSMREAIGNTRLIMERKG